MMAHLQHSFPILYCSTQIVMTRRIDRSPLEAVCEYVGRRVLVRALECTDPGCAFQLCTMSTAFCNTFNRISELTRI